MKDNDRNRALMAEVIAHVWRDPAYRAELKRAPKQTLQQVGMTIAANAEVVVLENTPAVIHAVLPPKAEMQRFAARLPKAVAMLTDMPDTIEVRVHRDSATRFFLVIPAVPAAVKPGELTDAQLEQVAGGKGHHDSTMAVTQTVAVQTGVTVTTGAIQAEGVVEIVVAVTPCFIS